MNNTYTLMDFVNDCVSGEDFFTTSLTSAGKYPLPQFPLSELLRNKETKEMQLNISLSKYSKEEIKITSKDNILTISTNDNFKEEDLQKFERLSGKIKKVCFSANYFIPTEYDIKNLKASWKKSGLLTITIPLKEEERGTEYTIE